jgi:hypothetical protein
VKFPRLTRLDLSLRRVDNVLENKIFVARNNKYSIAGG